MRLLLLLFFGGGIVYFAYHPGKAEEVGNLLGNLIGGAWDAITGFFIGLAT